MTIGDDEARSLTDVERAPVRTRTSEQVRAGRWQLFALCGTVFLHGWTNGSVGPLIPKIQEYYGLSYTGVSLVFVLQNVGSVCGSLGIVVLGNRCHLGTLLASGSLILVVGSALTAAVPVVPYAVFLAGNYLAGLGLGLLTTQSTGFVAALQIGPKTKMGIVQAAFGLGALLAPIASTRLSQLAGKRWAISYAIVVGMALLDTVNLCLIFRRRSQDECLKLSGQQRRNEEEKVEDPDLAASESPARSLVRDLRSMLALPAVHLLAGTLFICVGTEVVVGGWLVSFLIQVRGGSLKSGYVASGYWAGLMLGRLVLLPVNKWIGEVRAIYVYTAGCIGLELIIWFVPNFLVCAIAVSFIGLLIGPMFSIAMNDAARILPPRLLTPSISWLSAIAGTGASVLPLISGAIAGRTGFKSMQPFTIGSFVFMLVLWTFVPRRRT
ncbi:MFS domain-containing protein [Mycena kentingensis (nom. inval.)]|nr:MFS domain-containing protein [Mycena kentingensis (nom. inval.)]